MVALLCFAISILVSCGSGSKAELSLLPGNTATSPGTTNPAVDENPEVPSGMFGQLPAPGALGTSAVVTGPVATGAEYDRDLPSQLVEVDGDGLLFSPDWEQEGNRNAAFALWSLDVSAYTLDGTLSITSTIMNADPMNVWIGLPDYSRNAWTWRNLPDPPAPLEFDPEVTLSPAGIFYCAVVLVGTEQFRLDLLELGFELQPPQITQVYPRRGMPGQEAQFSAVNEGGQAESWEWDFGGGAVPNISSDDQPVVVLLEAGQYSCRVSAANAAGSDEFVFSLNVSTWTVVLLCPIVSFYGMTLGLDDTPYLVSGRGLGGMTHFNGTEWDYFPLDFGFYWGGMDTGPTGEVHIASQPVNGIGINYAVCNETGQVSHTFLDGLYTSLGSNPLKVGSSGISHLSYRDITYDWDEQNRYDDLVYGRLEDGNIVTTVVEAEGKTGFGSSIDLDSNGYPHIAWYNLDDYYPRYGLFNGTDWQTSFSSEVQISNTGICLVLDNNDIPRMSFVDWNSEVISYEVMLATVEDGLWSLEVVDQSTAHEFYSGSALGVDSANNLHLIYPYDGLRHAWTSGNGWQSEDLFSANDEHFNYLQLKVDSLDNIHALASYIEQPTMGPRYTVYLTTDQRLSFPPKVSKVESMDNHSSNLVKFTPSVIFEPETFLWDFGGGAEPNTSTEREPEVVLGSPGVYSCDLSVSNEYGSDYYEFELEVDNWLMTRIAARGRRASIDVNSADEPVIAVSSWADEGGLEAFYYDAGIWQSEPIDAEADTYSGIVRFDQEDDLYASWTDLESGILSYAWRTGDGWEQEAVAENGASSYLNFEIDSELQPHLLYLQSGLKHTYHLDGTWRTEQLPGQSNYYCSMKIDRLDRIHVTAPGDGADKLWYFINSGSNWSETLVAEVNHIYKPTLALDSLAKPHIAFGEWRDFNRDISHYWLTGNGWENENITHGADISGNEILIAVDSLNRIHIVYTNSADRLQYGLYASGNWQFETLIEEYDCILLQSSMVLDSHDLPHIALYCYSGDSLGRDLDGVYYLTLQDRTD